jgi:hypothetical protein
MYSLHDATDSSRMRALINLRQAPHLQATDRKGVTMTDTPPTYAVHASRCLEEIQRQVLAGPDDLARTILLSRELDGLSTAIAVLSKLRRSHVVALRQRMSSLEIAAQLGMSRARVYELLR